MPRSIPVTLSLAIALFAAGTSAQTVPALSWRRLPHEAAQHGAMVFDTMRARFVLQTTRTCEWDGIDWRERATANHPTATGAFGLAFDSTRGRTVLFGGASDSVPAAGPLQELWEYDGLDWTRRTFSGGPSARYRPAFAYDLSHQCAVLYGGMDANGSSLTDTWTWDGTTWRPILGSGPNLERGAAMAFHLPTARMVLFGTAIL